MDNYDTYFMSYAELGATRSKDSKTKVGSCIVKNKKILSIGYNGAPKGFPDNEVPEDSIDSDLTLNKNAYMVHSELNSILNYPGSLNDLKGSTLYVTISPCHECAKVIIQMGISRVVYKEEYHREEMWNMSKLLFNKCGIKYEKLVVNK